MHIEPILETKHFLRTGACAFTPNTAQPWDNEHFNEQNRGPALILSPAQPVGPPVTLSPDWFYWEGSSRVGLGQSLAAK